MEGDFGVLPDSFVFSRESLGAAEGAFLTSIGVCWDAEGSTVGWVIEGLGAPLGILGMGKRRFGRGYSKIIGSVGGGREA